MSEPKPKKSDDLFAEIVVEQGLLTEEQVAECSEARLRMTEMGFRRSLFQVVREKGLLNSQQVLQVRRSMKERGVLPRLGGYEILARLGQGGMGAVFKARHISLGRIVALKVLNPEASRDPSFVQRFQREAHLASQLQHPNIVEVYDVGSQNGRHFMAMEYVDGKSLEERVAGGPIPEELALTIARGVAEALAAAHAAGIIHRDIKPANILMTREGQPKLADLGLAKSTDADGVALTQTGAVVGTPLYMSPEQCQASKEMDHRTDIYSLGATLYHMVCGRPPFTGSSTVALIHKHVYDPLPDPRQTVPNLSAGLAGLLSRMMAKAPEDRYGSCEEVIQAIERTREEEVYEAERVQTAPDLTTLLESDAIAVGAEDEGGMEEEPAIPEEVVAGPSDDAPRRRRVVRPRQRDMPIWIPVTVALVGLIVAFTIIWVKTRGSKAKGTKAPKTPSGEAAVPPPESKDVKLLEKRVAEARRFRQEGKFCEALAALDAATRLAGQLECRDLAAELGREVGRVEEELRRAQGMPASVSVSATEPDQTAPAAEGPGDPEEPEVRPPKGWRTVRRKVRLATPEGRRQRELAYYVDPLGIPFVRISAGEREVATPKGQRRLFVKPFFLSAREVTVAEYAKGMGIRAGGIEGSDEPAVNKSFSRAVSFCKRLSRKFGVPYRLPTAAEWEHAFGAGRSGHRYWPDGGVGQCAWYEANSDGRLHDVGRGLANAYGVFDMAGNAWEWVLTPFDSPPSDFDNPDPGEGPEAPRTIKGGSYRSASGELSAPARRRMKAWQSAPDVGFRLVVSTEPAQPDAGPPLRAKATAGPPMPKGLAGFGVAWAAGRLHVAGGVAPGGSVGREHFVYDPAEGKWDAAAPPMPTARAAFRLVECEERLFAIGGVEQTHPYRLTNRVAVYDPKEKKWTEGAPAPFYLTRYAAAALKSKIFVFGGQRHTLRARSHNRQVLIYDARENKWEKGDLFAEGLDLTNMVPLDAVAYEDRIVVLAAEPGAKKLLLYDPWKPEWKLLGGTPFSAARRRVVMTRWQRSIVAAMDGGAYRPPRINLYGLDDGKWRPLDPEGLEMKGCVRFGAARWREGFLLLGGVRGGLLPKASPEMWRVAMPPVDGGPAGRQ